jgi:hypothetical protein
VETAISILVDDDVTWTITILHGSFMDYDEIKTAAYYPKTVSDRNDQDEAHKLISWTKK